MLPASRVARAAHVSQPAQISRTRSPCAADAVVAVVSGLLRHQEDHTVAGLPNAIHNTHGGPPSKTAAVTAVRTSRAGRRNVLGGVAEAGCGAAQSEGCRAYPAARRRACSDTCSSSID